MKMRILGVNSPYPRHGQATLGYFVTEEDAGWLLDSGCGIYRRLNEDHLFAKLDAVILTHLHYDHCADLPAVVLGATVGQGRERPLPVFLPPGETARLEKWLEACGFGFAAAYMDIREFSYGQATMQGNMAITMLEARHSLPAGILALAAGGRRLIYTGDTGDCPGLREAVSGADLLLAEACSLPQDVAAEKGHLPARILGVLARQAEVKELVITHLMEGQDPEVLIQQTSEAFGRKVHLAMEGQTYEI